MHVVSCCDWVRWQSGAPHEASHPENAAPVLLAPGFWLLRTDGTMQGAKRCERGSTHVPGQKRFVCCFCFSKTMGMPQINSMHKMLQGRKCRSIPAQISANWAPQTQASACITARQVNYFQPEMGVLWVLQRECMLT